MKKLRLFFFLLGVLILGGCQKNIDVHEVNSDDIRYHIETEEYISGEDISSPEESIAVDGKKYILVAQENKELETVKGYDLVTFEDEFKNVIAAKVDIPKTKMIDGQSYVLDEISILPSDTRKKQLTKTMTYSDTYPEEMITDTYFDQETENSIDVVYQLVDFNEEQSWIDDLEVPLTVYDYDAYTYMINGAMVTGTNEGLNISNAEKEILAYANMNPSDYQLLGAYWTGDAYEYGDTLCRNAVAYGRRIQRTVEAYYAADVELPALDNVKVSYICKKENPEKDIIKMCRTLVYREDNSTRIIVITVGLVIGIIFVLLLLLKLRKKEKKNV